jgi:pimeloyl-ACP methyl ester carboxylesterase
MRKKHMFVRTIGLVVLVAILAGCAVFGDNSLEVLTYTNGTTAAGKKLIVFMRGMGGNHKSFEEEGLVQDIRDRSIPWDMAAPSAGPWYYLNRTLTTRLKEDVIDPAKSCGYEEIWLIGFSMGGLGSLLYLKEYPGDIQGVCLIAPFLSYRGIQREIMAAGGLPSWDPGDYDPETDWQRMLWHWLKEYSSESPMANIHLAYGTQDPYVEGQQLLAGIVPKEHIITIAGGHDYATLKNLWTELLDSGIFINSMSSARSDETGIISGKSTDE